MSDIGFFIGNGYVSKYKVFIFLYFKVAPK